MTQIRLLLQEQSDLGLHCLSKEASKTFQQTIFVLTDTLMVNV